MALIIIASLMATHMATRTCHPRPDSGTSWLLARPLERMQQQADAVVITWEGGNSPLARLHLRLRTDPPRSVDHAAGLPRGRTG